MHHNFKPAKSGLFDAKIAREKHLRLAATYEHNEAVKRDVMTAMYGGRNIKHMVSIQLLDEGKYVFRAAAQHAQLRYSDRGDFTRCYRGGF
jgi:hypothetical protein